MIKVGDRIGNRRVFLIEKTHALLLCANGHKTSIGLVTLYFNKDYSFGCPKCSSENRRKFKDSDAKNHPLYNK